MAGGVQQLLTVVLAVDVQQLSAQGPELRHRQWPAVEPADIPSIGQDLPLDEDLPVLVGTHAVLGKPGERRQPGELGAHHRGLGPGADQLP